MFNANYLIFMVYGISTLVQNIVTSDLAEASSRHVATITELHSDCLFLLTNHSI